MSDSDEKIRLASKALAQVLSEAGKNYGVYAHSYEVTRVGSEVREFAYSIEVEELFAPRRISP